MKLGIIILLVLGLVAAGSAAMLVTTLQTKSSFKQKPAEESEVAVLNKDLSAMVVVTLNDFDKQSLPTEQLPPGAITTPTLAVGRVLAVPLVKGQILTESCFVSQGTGAQMVAALPDGMRAVTISLSGRTMPDRLLLYPGCTVDVLYTARLSSQDNRGQAMAATILRGIQVLAVDGESVVSNPQAEEGSSATNVRATTGGAQVTLLLDPKQAEALQLALENGTLSLTVRNPLDTNIGEMDATILNQQQLALFGSAMTLEALTASKKDQPQEQMKNLLDLINTDPNQQQIMKGMFASLMTADPNEETASQKADTEARLQTADSDKQVQQSEKEEVLQNQQPSDNRQDAPPRWGVIVISGRDTKTEEFLLTQSESSRSN